MASRNDIAAVMFDNETYDQTNPDGAVLPELCDIHSADLSGWHFIGGYVDGAIASLFSVQGNQMHFWVLRPYRMQARELLRESFGLWPYDVVVKIPVLYRPTINFAKKYGFKEMGMDQGAFKKNGTDYDVQILEYTWAV